ncbi:RNA polymerase sigma factor [Sphingobacterium yanglingense]|uniref:RNA polymerase sigma-70 factor (ECF subfamily) n=1 Tax=Sphingobacterium yanglingense TaxID=1437280 RepID=A0A4R6WDU8_9SPHI|nr:sigma-70 family RNA polymerase sigma factor [Sphingobacterium yanglingense]TDQ76322.1 RNA polymerase sigma-70 factor (ECF subfamily) [Sphingobacterium yanglingense]
MRDDLKYVEILCLGHEAGLQYFIAQFGEPLHFFAYKITKNREVSEEIVSESFCKLWQRKEKMETYEMIRSFLFSVTRNACYDHMGSAYQKKISLSHNDWTGIEGNEGDMLGQIIYIELIKQIVQELEKLPKQQAEVFRMAYLEGMETKEICDLLGTTTSTVYFAKSKAVSTLRMIFKEKDINLYMTFLLVTCFGQSF